MRAKIKPENRLLTPAEVAAMLRVDPKTVTRWARGGKLSSIRTPGGHRRYSESEVRGFAEWLAAGVDAPRVRRVIRPAPAPARGSRRGDLTSHQGDGIPLQRAVRSRGSGPAA